MRKSILIGFLVACSVLIAVGPAAADSDVFYPDGSESLALNLGSGTRVFAFLNDIDNIFIHAIDGFADLNRVNFDGFFASAFFLDFEGFNQGYLQYGVYTCPNANFFSCVVPGNRRGTVFL